jgi:site-specific recombinase XerD
VDVYTVKELLGHSKLETTAWYLCAADKAEVVKQLDVFPGLDTTG